MEYTLFKGFGSKCIVLTPGPVARVLSEILVFFLNLMSGTYKKKKKATNTSEKAQTTGPRRTLSN